jgi:hypothetical protein
MKTIITLDRANQPYGYPQLDSGSSINVSGSISAQGLIASTGSGHVVMYNTASGQFSFTASSAIGGGGGDATSDNFQQIFLLMGG